MTETYYTYCIYNAQLQLWEDAECVFMVQMVTAAWVDNAEYSIFAEKKIFSTAFADSPFFFLQARAFAAK